MPKDLSVKNVPDDIVERLRERAKKNHRSLQGELMAILEESAGPRKLTVEEVYEQAQKLKLGPNPLGVDIIRADRDAGYSR